MKRIALVLLFVLFASAVCFAEAPEARIGELETRVAAISSKAAIATFTAKIYGPCCLLVGLGMFFRKKTYIKLMEDFAKDSALALYGGFFALAIGITIVLLHNVWQLNWTVVITLLGWAAIIKGAWLILFPDAIEGFVEAYTKNENLMTVHSIAALIIGAGLTYFGYFG